MKPEQQNGTWVADHLWPVVNLDLRWISSHWNESSYELSSRLLIAFFAN